MPLSSVPPVAPMATLARDIVSLTIRNLLLLGVGLVVTTVIVATLDRDRYGLYQFAMAVLSCTAFLSLPGLKQVVIQETARGHHGALGPAARFRLRGSAVQVLALWLCAAYYAWAETRQDLALCLVAASLFHPIAMSLDTYQSYLLGRKQIALYARLSLATGLVVPPVTALVAWRSGHPAAVLFAGGAALALAHAAAHRVALRRSPPEGPPHATPAALRFGTGLSALGIIPMVMSHIDTLLIGTFFSMPQVAVLNLACLPIDKSKVLLGAVGEVLAPRVLECPGPALFRRANRTLAAYVAGVTAYVGVMALVLPFLYRCFFPHYPEVVPLAVYAMFSLLPSCPAVIMEMTLYAEERLRQTTVLRVTQGLFDGVSAYLLISTWGVPGAIVCRYLSGTLRTALVAFFYIRNRRAAPQGG